MAAAAGVLKQFTVNLERQEEKQKLVAASLIYVILLARAGSGELKAYSSAPTSSSYLNRGYRLDENWILELSDCFLLSLAQTNLTYFYASKRMRIKLKSDMVCHRRTQRSLG